MRSLKPSAPAPRRRRKPVLDQNIPERISIRSNSGRYGRIQYVFFPAKSHDPFHARSVYQLRSTRPSRRRRQVRHVPLENIAFFRAQSARRGTPGQTRGVQRLCNPLDSRHPCRRRRAPSKITPPSSPCADPFLQLHQLNLKFSQSLVVEIRRKFGLPLLRSCLCFF